MYGMNDMHHGLIMNTLKGKKTPQTHPYSYDPFVTFEVGGEPNSTVYSDRLFQWDSAKHDRLCQKHFGDRAQYWDNRKPELIQGFLRDYTGRPDLVLIKITQHCNAATGYPCWQFDFKASAKNQ